MNIFIITVYNSHNFGSYLQAKQLFNTLRENGDVIFYNTYTRKLILTFLRKCKKNFLTSNKIKDKIRGSVFEFLEMARLHCCWRSLPSSGKCKNADVVILGSDEIWNLTRSACRFPIYWGDGVPGFKIAYAPSVNNATIEDMKSNEKYVAYLKNIDCVSVRDRHSQNVIGYYLQSKPCIVLDPTLLCPPMQMDYVCNEPYIAVYLFYGSLKTDEMEEIKRFAKKKKMKLVSAGQYISWCDFSVHSRKGDPFYIFRNAEYVITNTFHGTAYAINHNTRFAAFVNGKIKVEDMLDIFELKDRIVFKATELEKILETEINYKKVNSLLDLYRNQSFKYISDSLCACDNGISNRE